MTPPSHDSGDEAAAIAYGARPSILILATAGIIGYAAFNVFCLSILITGPGFHGFALFGALFGAYGSGVCLKLHRCGRKLSKDGRHLAEAMELHRQFWSHAPFLSLGSFVMLLAILWPAPQAIRIAHIGL
jgi:hypothetical protein